jgi:hypothetical protein
MRGIDWYRNDFSNATKTGFCFLLDSWIISKKQSDWRQPSSGWCLKQTNNKNKFIKKRRFTCKSLQKKTGPDCSRAVENGRNSEKMKIPCRMFEQGKSRPPFARPAQDTTATVLKGFTRVRWHTFFFYSTAFFLSRNSSRSSRRRHWKKKNCKLTHFRFFLYFLFPFFS